MYYHGARYYIPWLCRWTQCDPIGIKDGLNVYAYCSNNPVKLNDPSGNRGNDPQEDRPKAPTPVNSYQMDNTAVADNTRVVKVNPNAVSQFTPQAPAIPLSALLNPSTSSFVSPTTYQATGGSCPTPAAQPMIGPALPPDIQAMYNAQARMAEYHRQMSMRDPYAYQLAQSPGVQIGMAATIPGYGFTVGAIQFAGGVQSGDKSDMALGALGMAGGAFVKLPTGGSTPLINPTTFAEVPKPISFSPATTTLSTAEGGIRIGAISASSGGQSNVPISSPASASKGIQSTNVVDNSTYYGEFTYPDGTIVQMMADYNKTGNKVEFTNALFYAKDALGNELKNELGPALMRATFNELSRFAKSGGASEIRLQYQRALNSSSANPLHTFDRTFPIK